jgi:hypothetical protein
MATITLERLAEGIKRAHAAGDAAAVQKLGTAYRAMQAGGGADMPPAGAKPGSREYADWAMTQARAGKKLPQVSEINNFEAPKPDGLMDKAFAASGSFLEGMPLIGSTLIDLAKKGRAGVQGMTPEAVSAEYDAAKAANPITSTVAGVGGSIAALAPLGATAVGGRLLGMTGGFGSRLGFGIASGGALSGADALTRGATPQEARMSALAGGALGAAFPLIGAGFRKAVSPFAKTATDKATKLLKSEGVELTAGQATGSKGLRFREAELGGNSASEFMERQGRQYTAAALKKAGINADEASHDVIDKAFTDIGAQFDGLISRNAIMPDTRLARDLQAGWRRFEGATGPSTRAPVIKRILDDIYGAGTAGPISGAWYKAQRTALSKLTKSSNPELAEAAGDFMGALDDAMERTLSRSNPADLGAWREARRLYKNMLVIEDAATRAGSQSADGIITPQALRSAAIRQNKRAFARGRNEFVDLADAGVTKMTPLPDSGTAGRLSAKTVLPIGAATGASLGALLGGGLPGAVMGGVAGAAIPWAAGKGMMSGLGRAYLGNGAMAGGRALPALPPALLPLELTKKREPVEITIGTRGL